MAFSDKWKLLSSWWKTSRWGAVGDLFCWVLFLWYTFSFKSVQVFASKWWLEYLLGSFVLWVAFALLSGVKRKYDRGEITGWRKPLAFLFAILFVIDDVHYRFVYGTWIMLSSPRIETMTSLLQRHYGKPGYKGTVANFYCDELIHRFDKGHCIP